MALFMVRAFPGHRGRAGAWVVSLYGFVQRENTLWAGGEQCMQGLGLSLSFGRQLCQPVPEPQFSFTLSLLYF